MKEIPQNVSEAVRKRNPHLYGPPSTNGLCTIPRQKPKPNTLPALDSKPPMGRPSKRGVAVVVTLISCRRRLLDEDNLVYSLKGLRDAVAKSIGIDDGSRRIKWHYGQCETTGRSGTVVTIETL